MKTNNFLKIGILFIIGGAFLLLPRFVTAQRTEPCNFKLGLGISPPNILEHYYLLDPFRPMIHVGMNIGKYLRIEPFMGVYQKNNDVRLNIGFGLFAKKPYERFSILYGYRYQNIDRRSTLHSFCMGGEYFFAKRLSVSAELNIVRRRVQYTTFLTQQNQIAHYMYIKPFFTARFYFGKSLYTPKEKKNN